ncbi:MAG: type II toxin-antitoxin system VapC family toxin [Acidobacteriota bacterium]
MIVVDASVALAWALPDELSTYADVVLARAEDEALYVPELWPREVANGLAIAFRRQRITIAEETAFLDGLSRLTIRVERTGALETIRDGAAAARQYGLTAYDAAYVALAAREGIELATLDGRMREVALKNGVKVFDA